MVGTYWAGWYFDGRDQHSNGIYLDHSEARCPDTYDEESARPRYPSIAHAILTRTLNSLDLERLIKWCRTSLIEKWFFYSRIHCTIYYLQVNSGPDQETFNRTYMVNNSHDMNKNNMGKYLQVWQVREYRHISTDVNQWRYVLLHTVYTWGLYGYLVVLQWNLPTNCHE